MTIGFTKWVSSRTVTPEHPSNEIQGLNYWSVEEKYAVGQKNTKSGKLCFCMYMQSSHWLEWELCIPIWKWNLTLCQADISGSFLLNRNPSKVSQCLTFCLESRTIFSHHFFPHGCKSSPFVSPSVGTRPLQRWATAGRGTKCHFLLLALSAQGHMRTVLFTVGQNLLSCSTLGISSRDYFSKAVFIPQLLGHYS